MQMYQLFKKDSILKPNPAVLKSAFINRFFFREGDASCYKIDYHIDFMLENCITEMYLFLAKREVKAPYFFADILVKYAKSQKVAVVKYARAIRQEIIRLGFVSTMATPTNIKIYALN